MKRYLIIVVFQFLVTSFTYAQGLGFTKTPDVDTNYVSSSWDTWSMRFFGGRKATQFTIRSKETDTRIRYMPNKLFSVGVGIAYKFIVLDVGFALPVSGESSKRFDAQVSFKLQGHLIDLGYRRYKGFDANDNYDVHYDFRHDIRSQLFGINYFHHFASNKMPWRTYTTGQITQKKSFGSFGFGAYWFWNQLKADSSVIPDNLNELYNDHAKVHFVSQYSLGVMAGYAYGLALPKNLFIFAAVLPGIGINTGIVKAVDEYNPPLFPAAKINLRVAFGYMGHGNVYVILSGHGDGSYLTWGHQNRYAYTVANLKLVIGYRFNSEIGFLEKIANRIQNVHLH